MLKKWMRIWTGILLLFGMLAGQPRVLAAADEFEQAQLEYLSALASMAAYNDQLNLVVRAALQDNGWQVQGFRMETEDVDGRFFLVSRDLPGQRLYLLAVPGTEGKKDIRIDMRFSKILFAGNDPDSFAKAVEKKDVTSRDPLVHRGFEQYTRTTFFTAGKSGVIPGVRIQQELAAAPGEKLYLTGHSLGGAAVTLLAARLTAMGVPAEQLQVTTFGAPAVGNASFARQYGDALSLERIVIGGDPVNQLLQSLPAGYAQFGRKVVWQQQGPVNQFEHYMVVYLDAALRNYYDTRFRLGKQREDARLLRGVPACPAAVYVAPLQFSLPEELEKDAPYMRAALEDMLAARLQKTVFAPPAVTSLTAACRAAKKQGCSYVLQATCSGAKFRQQRENYRLTMEEALYDTDGNMLTMQMNSTDTSSMTPIEAMLYNQLRGQENREAALTGKVSEKNETQR